MKTGIELVAEEAKISPELEEIIEAYNDTLTNGELANAGAYLALTDDMVSFMGDSWGNDMHLHIWPFALDYLKEIPGDRIKRLTKAAAYIVKEIDRLNKY